MTKVFHLLDHLEFDLNNERSSAKEFFNLCMSPIDDKLEKLERMNQRKGAAGKDAAGKGAGGKLEKVGKVLCDGMGVCEKAHFNDGNCKVCSQPYGPHSGHRCASGEQGHWDAAPSLPSPTSSGPLCDCGVSAVQRTTKKGREYWACKGKGDVECEFFQWVRAQTTGHRSTGGKAPRKGTARRSTGGKAPRKLLAVASGDDSGGGIVGGSGGGSGGVSSDRGGVDSMGSVGMGGVEDEAWCVFGHPLIDRMILPSDMRCSTCNGDLPTILRAAELRRKARATRRAAAAAAAAERRWKGPTRTYCEGCGDYHTDSEEEEETEEEEEDSNGEDDDDVVEEAWEEG